MIGDFDVNVSSDVLVERNTAQGNLTIAGPLDLSVTSVGDNISVSRNHCEYDAPNTDWCSN